MIRFALSLLLLSAFVCFYCQTAWAQDEVEPGEFDVCLEQAGIVTSEILTCIQAEKEKYVAQINAAYEELMSFLPPERKKELEEAHNAWHGYRKKYWEFKMGLGKNGGTSLLVMAAHFNMEVTKAHAQQLSLDLHLAESTRPVN